ncbi:MAG: hypothetical protein AAGL98_04110 [Planctomycetota bacterium]
MTKTTLTKDGSRWAAGLKLSTDAEELKRRGVPAENYRVDAQANEPAKPAPKPGEIRTGDVPSPRKKKRSK